MRVREDVTYCSSCFQAKPGTLHVDFDAAWDGPVIDAVAQQQIDDLIICADCLDEAARLLGYANDGTREKLAALEERVEEIEQRRDKAEAALAKVKAAMPRGPGRPRKEDALIG